MSNKHDEPKIGSGHASAFFRQGLSELRAALYAESNVAQPPQYGLYGTRTPGEVAEARRVDGADRDEEHGVHGASTPHEHEVAPAALDHEPKSGIDERIADATKDAPSPEPEPPEPERD